MLLGPSEDERVLQGSYIRLSQDDDITGLAERASGIPLTGAPTPRVHRLDRGWPVAPASPEEGVTPRDRPRHRIFILESSDFGESTASHTLGSTGSRCSRRTTDASTQTVTACDTRGTQTSWNFRELNLGVVNGRSTEKRIRNPSRKRSKPPHKRPFSGP